ncbi:MAG TPA: tetratricopeptide repeat protein [Gemmataceae bacterium]|nr:tetratricopeptide repeat protein [Gemmataceae bacterium]
MNLKVLIGLVVVPLVLGVGVHFLHAYQVKRNAGAFLQQAERAAEAKDLDQALQHYATYLGFVPTDDDALARYAILLNDKAAVSGSRKARERAFLFLDHAVRRAPGRHDVRRLVVDTAMELGYYPAARDHLIVLLREAFPNDGQLEHLLGRCHAAAGEFDQAASLFARSIRHMPRQLDSYEWLAVQLRQRYEDSVRGQDNEFQRDLVRAGLRLLLAGSSPLAFPASLHWGSLYDSALHPADRIMDAMVYANSQSFQAYLVRWRYRTAHRLPEAEKELERARELAPDEAEVLVASARSAVDRNDLNRARAYLQRGIQLYPKDRNMYQALSDLEKRQGRREQAIAALRQGLKEVPPAQQGELLAGLIDLLIDGSEFEEANQLMTQLRQREIPSAWVDYLDARLLLAKGAWVQAAFLLEGARKQVGESSDLACYINLHLARCYERLGNPDLQLAACRRALAINPRWIDVHVQLGVALAAIGSVDEAVQEFRLLADTIPAAQALVARVLIHQNLRLPPEQRREPERWQPVHAALDQAAPALPDAVEVPLLRAQAWTAQALATPEPDRAKLFAAARAVLEAARDQQPQKVEFWTALADLAQREGDSSKALAILDEAQQRLGNGIELRLARVRHWAIRGGDEAPAALAKLAADLDRLSDKDRIRLLDALAEGYAQLGDAAQAERFYSRLAAEQPQDLRSRVNLFDLAVQTDNEPLVRRLVDELRTIEGTEGTWWRYCEGVRLLLAARKLQAKHEADAARPLLDTARQHLGEVSSRRPTWSRVYLLEGDIAVLQKDLDRAIDRYKQALLLGDTRPGVAVELARLLSIRGRYAEAEQVLGKLPPGLPRRGTAARLAVDLAWRRGDTKEALDLAEEVAAGSKDHADHLWCAEVQWNLGRRGRAEASLRRALELNDQVPEPWSALVTYLVRLGRQAEAKAVISEAQRKLPPAQAALGLAQCYDALGDRKQAEQFYVAALRDRAGEVAVLRAVANFYMRSGQPHKAEPLYRQLIDPKTAAPEETVMGARRSLAVVLAAKGEPRHLREALLLLDKNLSLQGNQTEDLRTKALLLSTQPGRRQEAIHILENLQERGVVSAEEQFLLAQLYEGEQDWVSARLQMEKLLHSPQGRKPNYLAHHVGSLLRRGELDAAQEWLAELEKLEPDSAQTVQLKVQLLKAQDKRPAAVALVKQYAGTKDARLEVVAALLETLGENAEAEALYRKYVTANEARQPESVLVLIGFLGRQGRPEEALALCERAWQTCPPEKVALASLAILNTVPGDRTAPYQRVEQGLRAAIAKNPSTELLLQLANLYYLQERYEEAESLFRQIIARDSRNATAVNNLAWLLALWRGKAAEALDLLTQTLERLGPLPDLLTTRGIIYLELKQSEPAIKDLAAALTQSSRPAAYLHLARAHLMARDRTAALLNWKKAINAGLTPSRLDPLERRFYEALVRELGVD